MILQDINEQNRPAINQFIQENWYSCEIVIRGKIVINAIKFYQKRGFDMVRLYHNAMDISRRLKPSIPMIGEYGIPLKHEIEFEMDLYVLT